MDLAARCGAVGAADEDGMNGYMLSRVLCVCCQLVHHAETYMFSDMYSTFAVVRLEGLKNSCLETVVLLLQVPASVT